MTRAQLEMDRVWFLENPQAVAEFLKRRREVVEQIHAAVDAVTEAKK